MEFFLAHSDGCVVCCDGEREQVCYSYPEAILFFAK